jgi:3-deoxy-D-manno-octulosonic-acid transferase
VTEVADRHPCPEVVIAATTDTGYARARTLFASDHVVVRYPLDFSASVSRFLDRIDTDVVVLTELEVWPNLVAACARRGIPVGVINGRLSERSFRWYRLVRPLLRPTFARLAFAAVQTDDYADRFRVMGVAPDRIEVTGTMKWDTAHITDTLEGAEELAAALGIDRARPLVVAGSTAPEEHALLHRAVPRGVQLLCAPRRPEWFDQAERDLPGSARRSHGNGGSVTDRYLLDTIGELRAAYALADLVVVGRSFGRLHGSDMIEPIALGKPTIIGPATDDFQATVEALLAGDGLVQTDRATLPRTISSLLADPARRAELAVNGRAVIRGHQGATARTGDVLRRFLVERRPRHD